LCGIAGFASTHPEPQEIDFFLTKAGAYLSHRGPDGLRTWESDDRKVGFLHARLSVIDLELGWQPMVEPETNITISFNGEIYNFKELRKELENEGQRFHTHSDTEVILYSYLRWGLGCLEKFNGMFAFAIFDPRDNSIVLARDPLGIKPLHYSLHGNQIRFSSELRPLAILKPDALRLSEEGLIQYLHLGYSLAPTTLIEGVHQLSQGSWLKWQHGKVTTGRFFDLAKIANGRSRAKKKKSECEEELEEILKASVKRHMISDVPVGVVLSGGVDSSLISASAISFSDKPLSTFTLGFRQREFSEISEARKIARALGTTHFESIFDEEKFLESIEDISWKTDGPLFDSSFPATLSLYGHVRKNVKVALSGDGGDELFLGYETYRADALARWIKKGGSLFRHALNEAAEKLPTQLGKVTLSYKAKAFARSLHRSPAAAHSGWRELGSESLYKRILSPSKREIAHVNHPALQFEKLWSEVPDADYLTRMSYIDCKTWLPNDILVKGDRSSMAHGLELRVPLLDKELVKFALSLEDRQKFSFKTPKLLLKNNLRKKLPNYPISQTKKGFGTPVSHWILGEKTSLFSEFAKNPSDLDGFLAPNAVATLFNEHLNRQVDHGYLIWSLFVFHTWWERCRKERAKLAVIPKMPEIQSDAHLP
jgi:asparagine synthase (glutamine-hydrolysing)